MITKRILFCWFSQPHLQTAVHEFLDENDFDFVGLMGRTNYLGDKADVFLSSSLTRKGCATPDISKYVPSRDIIERMRSTEAEVLKMMDRSFKSPFKPRQYEFRKRLYYAQLCMAYGFLVEHKFDRVIFSNIPHNPFDFTLFGLCKAMGITASFYYQLQVKDCFLHAYDLEELYQQLALPDKYADENKEWDLPPHLEEDIDERLGKKAPFYMNANRETTKPKLSQKLKPWFRIQTYTRPLYSLPSWLAYQKIPKYQPKDGDKFVYFALHMQPEATTSPMGGVFVDQYYVILMIARALPEGVKVVVKEHPHQEFWQRSPDFYNLLKAEPNIEFVSLKQNSFELITQSIAVATITGTVGWEALFLNKPVILFGHIFYKHLPGVINVNDTDSLNTAIQQILDKSFKLCSLNNIRALLHHTNELSYAGAIDDDYFEISHLTVEENVQSAKSALTDFIK